MLHQPSCMSSHDNICLHPPRSLSFTLLFLANYFDPQRLIVMNNISSSFSEYGCQMSMKMLLSIFIIITISFVSTALPPEGWPEGWPVQCLKAVSIDEKTSNELCRSYCKNYFDDFIAAGKFSRLCQIERFTFDYSITDVVKIDLQDQCFDQWIIGYLDEDESQQREGNVGRVIPNVSEATDCQQLCQNDESCDRWAWRAAGIPHHRLHHSCQLKTSEMVDEALSIRVEDKDTIVPPTDKRWMWCNMTRGSQCNGGQCVKCGVEARCVYKSAMHISGPKWCRPKWGPPKLIHHFCKG